MNLEELPLDVGYASEKVTLLDAEKNTSSLGGHNGKTQLFITIPFIDAAFVHELQSLKEILPVGGDYEVTASLIVANETHTNPSIEGIDF
jgi:peroxiredoxin